MFLTASGKAEIEWCFPQEIVCTVQSLLQQVFSGLTFGLSNGTICGCKEAGRQSGCTWFSSPWSRLRQGWGFKPFLPSREFSEMVFPSQLGQLMVWCFKNHTSPPQGQAPGWRREYLRNLFYWWLHSWVKLMNELEGIGCLRSMDVCTWGCHSHNGQASTRPSFSTCFCGHRTYTFLLGVCSAGLKSIYTWKIVLYKNKECCREIER